MTDSRIPQVCLQVVAAAHAEEVSADTACVVAHGLRDFVRRGVRILGTITNGGSMLRVEVDTSCFPLVLQTLRFGYTEDDMRKGLSRFLELFARGRRYAVAVHLEPGTPVAGPSMRALIGAFQEKHQEEIKRCNVCVAVVLPSFPHRAAMTALNWLFPPVTPTPACASILEAVDICCERLTAEGIQLTPAILQLQRQMRRDMGYTNDGVSL